MTRGLPMLWLLVMVVVCSWLGVRVHGGLHWRTDLMALLPRDEQDVGRQEAEDAVTRALSQRLVLLVGHPDAARARAAAATLAQRLTASGVAEPDSTVPGSEAIRRLGALYAPFRRGLLSEADRASLRAGDGEVIVTRALAQVFGFVGLGDAKLLQVDPFLLLPGFFAGLPVPFARLAPVEGVPMVWADGVAWVLVAARVTADPYALEVQERLIEALGIDALTGAHAGLRVLRLGAVFYAAAGAAEAIGESGLIGLASTLGTVLLIMLAYRALAPLWLSLLVIASGVVAGLAVSLLVFGELHVATLLFGVSLIGVAVDYSLQYCTEVFAAPAPPAARLARVCLGITLGTATTVIGYLTLLLAPFPGLHQIAVFSAAGLFSAWLTVMLWLPALDRSQPARHGGHMLAWAAKLLDVWRRPRRLVIVPSLMLATFGLWHLHADDDVRRMQSLSGPLVAEQTEIRRLIGGTGDGPFFLVRAPDDETALQAEETLGERLVGLRAEGALSGWLSPARFIPSAARQRDNRALVARTLDPLLPGHRDRLGLEGAPQTVDDEGPVLDIAAALAGGAPLGLLAIAPGVHVITLEGLTRPTDLAAAAEGISAIAYVDPAGRFTALLAKYRVRAIGLLALSAALMAPLLAWRYGLRGAARVMAPPLLAVLLAPALRALGGAGFSFFDAMALVLVLSIGVDYAIFCAETAGTRAPVTMLAVTLAAVTALLSFGLLAMSNVAAVHSFGATMAIGVLLAFLFAPMAGR